MDQPNWNAGSLLGLSGSYWKACALHAAVELDLFSHLGREPVSAPEAAGRIGGSARGVAMLLRALSAMGLLQRRGERYANGPEALALLCRESPQYIGHMILHHRQLMPSWARLDQAVREGAPVRERVSLRDETARRNFLMGMFNMAMSIAPRLAKTLDLSGRRRLLDLGGGPGTYATHFCLENPTLEAVIFDLPTSRPFAEGVIGRFGMQQRVRFAGGDFLVDPLPAAFDVVWLSHILHAEGPEQAQHVVRRASAALESGGMLLIHEFILDDHDAGPLFPALFSLNMLTGTPSGQSYSEAELRAMMAAAGLRAIRLLPFEGPTESRILVGEAR